MEQPRPTILSQTGQGELQIPKDIVIESPEKRGAYLQMCQILRPELEDHVLERSLMALSTPVFLISRGVEIDTAGNVRPATFGRTPTAPNNGSLASGESRIAALAAANRTGILQSRHIIATSGDTEVTNPHTQEKQTINYGQAHIGRLEEAGVTQLSDGTVIDMDIQGSSNDTFGEVLATGTYIRHRVESDPQFVEELQKSGGEVTFFSSDDQLPRLAVLQVLVELQGKSTDEVGESIQFLRDQLTNGPLVRYINTFRDEIIEEARQNPALAETTVKTLFLLDNIDLLTNPTVLKWASNGMFSKPRFAATIEKCAPHLHEDLQWMEENGIKINHLTTEELIIAHYKRMEATPVPQHPDERLTYDANAKESRKLMRWLSHIYGVGPSNNQLLSTFLMETAGCMDLLTNYYYAAGSLKEEKNRFVEEISQIYDIPLPSLENRRAL